MVLDLSYCHQFSQSLIFLIYKTRVLFPLILLGIYLFQVSEIYWTVYVLEIMLL